MYLRNAIVSYIVILYVYGMCYKNIPGFKATIIVGLT